MKVLTLSLHSYQELNQMEKFKLIAKTIIDEEIDVVCFTEAAQRLDSPMLTDGIRVDNAIKIIADEMEKNKVNHGYHYAWTFCHYGFKFYEEGSGILSRYPIINTESIYISNTDDPLTFKSRRILKASLNVDDEEIDVYCCHLGWKDDEYEPFETHFERLDTWVQSFSKQSILAGNFANDVTTICYDQIIDAKYRDCYSEAKPEGYYDETFASFSRYVQDAIVERHRIDYIFANELFRKKAIQAQLLFTEERVSDHFGVCVEFEN